MWPDIERLIRVSQNKIRNMPLESVKIASPERRNYYRFLYHLAQWRKPYTMLEIGVESGMASAYMCKGLEGGQVIGVDVESVSVDYPNYHFVHGDSTDLQIFAKVSAMVQDYGPIGVVYQDSSHHYLASKKEWELYSSLLDENAIWICDDITPAFWNEDADPPGKGMVQYFEELPGNKRLYPDVLHYGNAQGIVLL